MTGERARGRRFRWLPLGFAVALVVLSVAGVAAAGGPGPPAKAQSAAEDLNSRILSNPWLLTLHYLPALVGLGLFVAAIVKRATTPMELRLAPGPPPVSVFGTLSPQFDVVAAIFLFIAVDVVASIAGSIAEARWPGSSAVSGVGILCKAMGWVPVTAWILFRRREAMRDAPRPLARPSRVGGAAWTFCVASAGMLAAYFVVALVYLLVLHQKPEPQSLAREVISPAVPLDRWLIVGFGVLVAPLAEETLFRGTLYPAFRRGIGPVGAAVVVSAIFAAVHRDWAAALPLFVLALCLTWLFERTNSVLAPTLVHAASNAASFVKLLGASGDSG